MSDVGMTGDYDSVIGMAKEEPTAALPAPHLRARGSSRLRARRRCARSPSKPTAPTGLATRVGAVRLGGCLEQATPAFWS